MINHNPIMIKPIKFKAKLEMQRGKLVAPLPKHVQRKLAKYMPTGATNLRNFREVRTNTLVIGNSIAGLSGSTHGFTINALTQTVTHEQTEQYHAYATCDCAILNDTYEAFVGSLLTQDDTSNAYSVLMWILSGGLVLTLAIILLGGV